MFKRKPYSNKLGFTIVELLVVIVVIGILAVVVIASFDDISDRAVEASLRSDLKNASTQLEIDYNLNGDSYPLNINDINGGKGLQPSPGTTFQYSATASTYCLSSIFDQDSSIAYHTSSDDKSIQESACPQHSLIPIPDAPVIDVALDGANAVATITETTCLQGSPQYSINSRIDDGSWDGWTAWSTNLTASRTANDGVKYGYQARARCHTTGQVYSSISTGVEDTYTDPISAPSAPVVTATTGSTTTWSWPAVTCATGSARYQYEYTISPIGYDSGWVSYGTNLSIPFTTLTAGQTYTVAVQAQCYNSNIASNWSSSGSDSYIAQSVWKQISAGLSHTCAIASNDKAYCWGDNSAGELGNNSTTQSKVPVAVYTDGVLSGKTIKQIAAGASGYNTCAIASDDLLYCWGSNSSGQYGNNTTTESHVPVAAANTGALSGKTIKLISLGGSFACAIASDNLAYCWGAGSNAELGNNDVATSYVPVAVYRGGVWSDKTVKSLDSGAFHTCAIASDNLAYCWGYGAVGEIGDSGNHWRSVPTAAGGALGGGKTIKSISVGAYHSCAVASDDKAYCWGYNTNGQLGNNSTSNASSPVAVNEASGVSDLYGRTVKYIDAGAYFTCVIASDDKAYCWGANNGAQLGDNTITQRNVAVAVYTGGVLNSKIVSSISGGDAHTAALSSTGSIYSWGYNYYGELGNDTTTNSSIPISTQSPP